MTALATLITELRILANDSPSANYIRGETLKPRPDGTRKNFYLDYQNIVPNSVFITAGAGDANYRQTSGFTVDGANGIVVFDSAPLVGVNPFEADYNYNWFRDADHQEFLVNGSKLIGYPTPESVIAGLASAMLHFGLYFYWLRRAASYAHKYSSTGGLAAQQVDVVTGNFKSLAKMAWDMGTKFRDDYYKRLGQREAPSSTKVAYGIDPFTPIR